MRDQPYINRLVKLTFPASSFLKVVICLSEETFGDGHVAVGIVTALYILIICS